MPPRSWGERKWKLGQVQHRRAGVWVWVWMMLMGLLPGFLKLPQGSEVIGPRLHHGGAWLEVQRMVVGCTDCVALLVRELQLDVLMRPALLVQDRRSNAAKSMAGHATAVPIR